MATDHIADDDLEGYSLGRLPEAATAPVEEHLLVCGDCRVRLEEWDEYCRAIRTASRLMKSERAARAAAPRSRTASSG